MCFSVSVTPRFHICKPSDSPLSSLVSCCFLACFQLVIPVLFLLGCRVVKCAAVVGGRHLCLYWVVVLMVLKRWSRGTEGICFSKLFIAVSMQQNSRYAVAKQQQQNN